MRRRGWRNIKNWEGLGTRLGLAREARTPTIAHAHTAGCGQSVHVYLSRLQRKYHAFTLKTASCLSPRININKTFSVAYCKSCITVTVSHSSDQKFIKCLDGIDSNEVSTSAVDGRRAGSFSTHDSISGCILGQRRRVHCSIEGNLSSSGN